MTAHFEAAGQARVVAYTVDRAYLSGLTFEGRPLVAFEDLEARYPPSTHSMFVAIGYRSMRARQALFERAQARGYTLPGFISPRAVIPPGFEPGQNNVLLDQVLVEPFATIGHNNVLWSGTIVCHDVRVGDHCYLGARCVLGGGSKIERGSFLGNAVTTIDHVTVAPETQVLPGSVVFQDTLPFTRYLGSPARAIGRHEELGIRIERE